VTLPRPLRGPIGVQQGTCSGQPGIITQMVVLFVKFYNCMKWKPPATYEQQTWHSTARHTESTGKLVWPKKTSKCPVGFQCPLVKQTSSWEGGMKKHTNLPGTTGPKRSVSTPHVQLASLGGTFDCWPPWHNCDSSQTGNNSSLVKSKRNSACW
jgi:hypothetical protein